MASEALAEILFSSVLEMSGTIENCWFYSGDNLSLSGDEVVKCSAGVRFSTPVGLDGTRSRPLHRAGAWRH